MTTSTPQQSLPIVRPARAEIMRGVARFREMYRNEGGGTLDASLDGYRRAFYNVLSYEPAEGSNKAQGVVSAAVVDNKAHISHLQTGFGMLLVEAQPENAVLMHAHDTAETFMVIEGKWSMGWEGERGKEFVELGPLDVVSFPPFVHRMFRCIAPGEGKKVGLLLAMISGEAPKFEYSREAVQVLTAAGKLPAQA